MPCRAVVPRNTQQCTTWQAEWGNGAGSVEELTQEQEFLLARLAHEARELTHTELVHALLEAWTEKFSLKALFEEILQEHGIFCQLQEKAPCCDPSDVEGMAALFGYIPSDEELADYFDAAIENATMELDMDDIVLSRE